MSREKKKLQKKKEREREVRKKILLRREESRKNAPVYETPKKISPITRENFEKAQAMHKQEVKLKIAHNMKILKAIEQAMAEEEAAKKAAEESSLKAETSFVEESEKIEHND